MARSCRSRMSAIRSLPGVNRTSSEWSISVEIDDPKPTSTVLRCLK